MLSVILTEEQIAYLSAKIEGNLDEISEEIQRRLHRPISFGGNNTRKIIDTDSQAIGDPLLNYRTWWQ